MSDTDTVYLYLASDSANRDVSFSGGTSNFRVMLSNPILDPLSADLVSAVFTYATYHTYEAPPKVVCVSSRALGQNSITSSSSGERRWWRLLQTDAMTKSQVSDPAQPHVVDLAYINPRIEHTPVLQPLLQEIDIQLTDLNGVALGNLFPGGINVYLVVAVRVKRA